MVLHMSNFSSPFYDFPSHILSIMCRIWFMNLTDTTHKICPDIFAVHAVCWHIVVNDFYIFVVKITWLKIMSILIISVGWCTPWSYVLSYDTLHHSNTLLNAIDRSGYGFSQWETTLLWNVVIHWLSQYPECFLNTAVSYAVTAVEHKSNFEPRFNISKNVHLPELFNADYDQISNISRTLVGNWIVDHSDVVGASPGLSGLLQLYFHSLLNTWLQ